MNLEKRLLTQISDLVKWAFSGKYSVNRIATEGGLISQTLSVGKGKGEEWNPSLYTILGLARAHDILMRRERDEKRRDISENLKGKDS